MSDASDAPVSVLHVVSYYPPDRVGGVGEHVRVIHEGHASLGLDSMVLTSGSTDSGSRVHRLGRTPIGFVLNSWRGLALARGRDVIHAHHGEGLLFLMLTKLRRNRPRILVMFHVDVRRREAANRAHWFDDRRYGPGWWSTVWKRASGAVKVLFERAAWALSDEVVVETHAVRTELSDMWPRREIHVVAHGLGESRSLGEEASPVDILFVGTPGVRKRTHLLPAVLERVRRDLPGARLRIVGFHESGDSSLVADAERLGVRSAIEFVGPVRSEEVVPHYRSARVLLLPSAYEGLPMVLLEAMREGLPVVATAVSGHPEAIENGVNGYLVALDDVDAMAERCVRILSDEALAAEMAAEAESTITGRFSVGHELSAYSDMYIDLLRAHP